MAEPPEIEYEPRLIEAAVLTALRGHAWEGSFHAERSCLYEIPDAEAREPAFAALHARWFQRLRLDQPFRVALDERPEISARCHRCVAVRATAAPDEGAELFVAPLDVRTVLIRSSPETVAAPERLLRFLRHELLHIADMLDPGFGYEPRLPGGREHANRRLRERYRVLWDVFVDGRLMRRGDVPPSVRAERLGDFERAFPALGEATPAAFARFFDGAQCTHAELLAFAQDASGRGTGSSAT